MKVPVQEVIGSNIRAFRSEADWTQQELAEEMANRGVPWRRETVAQSEGEGRSVTLSEILVLCQIFNQPIDALMIPRGELSRSEVIVTPGLIFNPRELRRLVRAGETTNASRRENDKRRLLEHINSLQLQLSKAESKLEEIQETKNRIVNNLRERQRQLDDLENSGRIPDQKHRPKGMS
jgi:transcriptional regulator with XRE-family HTH domain